MRRKFISDDISSMYAFSMGKGGREIFSLIFNIQTGRLHFYLFK